MHATSRTHHAGLPSLRRSLLLQEQIRQLTERKYELQQEEERSKAAPEEQREQLMARIKRDNHESEQVGIL
jgi:intraflagellar transport protein 74